LRRYSVQEDTFCGSVWLRGAVSFRANNAQIIITELDKLHNETNRHSSVVITMRAPGLTPSYCPGVCTFNSDVYVLVHGTEYVVRESKTTRRNYFQAHIKLNSVALVRERTMPTEHPPLVGEVVPTFADRGCRVVSATDSHGR
jgi:hypothetical protein